jgi:hypothetical protein
MSLQTITTPFGFTIFCDDIRNEVDGKMSLIGSYNMVMYVNGDFPAVIPKFSFLINYMERIGDHEGPVTLKVYLPRDSDETPTVSFEVPGYTEARKSAPRLNLPDGYESPEPADPVLPMRVPVVLAPMIIHEPGIIRVRAECEGRVYKLGALLVRQAPLEDAALEEEKLA